MIYSTYTGDPESPSITAYDALRQIATSDAHSFNKPGPGELRTIYTAIAGESGGARLID